MSFQLQQTIVRAQEHVVHLDRIMMSELASIDEDYDGIMKLIVEFHKKVRSLEGLIETRVKKEKGIVEKLQVLDAIKKLESEKSPPRGTKCTICSVPFLRKRMKNTWARCSECNTFRCVKCYISTCACPCECIFERNTPRSPIPSTSGYVQPMMLEQEKEEEEKEEKDEETRKEEEEEEEGEKEEEEDLSVMSHIVFKIEKTEEIEDIDIV